jgi:hypothetical protein
MHVKIPTLNAINFAVIFGIITHLTNGLFGSNLWLNILVWLVIGFIIGLIINLIFDTRHPNNARRPRSIPEKVSTKMIVIPSILLFVLIVVSSLYMAGLSPFKSEGQITAETEEVVEEIVEEPEIEYAGRCEQKELNQECQIIDGDRLCAHVEDWDRLKYKCDTVDDCIDQMFEDDKDFDEDDIVCNLETS